VARPDHLFTTPVPFVHNGHDLADPPHALESVVTKPRLFHRSFGVFAITLKNARSRSSILGGDMQDTPELEVWTTPDFVEYETPMEVTAYAARMD
jgi:coenzyme PQQ precursor peptide PqqA